MISTNKDNKAFEVFPKHLGAKLVVTRVYYFNYHYYFFFSQVFFLPHSHFLDHAVHEPSPFLYILMKKVFSLPLGDRQLGFCANPVRYFLVKMLRLAASRSIFTRKYLTGLAQNPNCLSPGGKEKASKLGNYSNPPLIGSMTFSITYLSNYKICKVRDWIVYEYDTRRRGKLF